MRIGGSLVFGLLMSGCMSLFSVDQLPDKRSGHFVDDYDIAYTISADRWIQHPNTIYHIETRNEEEQYVTAQNDDSNLSGAGLWTRIDWMELEGMEPYTWAFCISAYDVSSPAAAERVEIADRANPRTGCNGFPFSRMKRNQ